MLQRGSKVTREALQSVLMRGRIVPSRENGFSRVMASEIEVLPDRAGYLKLASEPVWMKVEFPVYDLSVVQKAFVAG